jgi:uncharacterized protein (DUF1778 family)
MPHEPSRSARIEARIAPDALLIVKRAAELQGRGVGDFVVDTANMAQPTIEETHIIGLAVEDIERFSGAHRVTTSSSRR